MIKLFKKCDIFGISFSFSIDKEKQYRTTFGGFFSIAIIIIIIGTFGYYLSELISRTKFTFYTQEILDDSPPTIYFDKNHFNLYFDMSDQYGVNYYDERIFSVKLFQVYEGSKNTSLLNNSKISSIYEEIPLSFCERKFRSSICIDDKFNSIFVINGTYNDDMNSYLEMRLDVCKDKTKNGEDCLSQEEIKTKMKFNEFSIFYSSFFIDLNEIDQPIKNFLTMDSYIVSYNYRRSVTYFLKNLFFYSDNDWIFTDNSNMAHTAVLHDIRDSIQYMESSQNILRIRIKISSTITKYFRNYSKFLQIFVNMGGLINSLLVVGSVVTGYINDIRMKLFIMNRLYDFVEDEEELKVFKRRSNLKVLDIKNIFRNFNKLIPLNKNLGEVNKGIKSNESHISEESKVSSEKENSDQSSLQNNYNNDYNLNELPSTLRNLNSENILNIQETKKPPDFHNNITEQKIISNSDITDSTISNFNKKNNSQMSIFKKIKLLNLNKNINNNDNFTIKDIKNSPSQSQEKEIPIFNPKNEINKNNQSFSQINSEKSHEDFYTDKKSNHLRDDSQVNLDSIEGIINFDQKRNKKFYLSYWHLFLMSICCCISNKNTNRNKIQMYEKAEEEISKTFDVVEIYKELHKMSAFISFYLNTEQMLLLKHVERPKIIFKNLEPESKKKKIEHYIKCFNSFKEIKKNSDKEINKKLLEKLDFNMKEVFLNMNK